MIIIIMEIMVINSSEIDKINSSVFEILIKLLIIKATN